MKNVGDLIAHWNVECKKIDRDKHFKTVKKFVEENGLDSVLEVKDVSFLDGDKLPCMLGYPKTRVDLVFKTPYINRVYRHAKTGSRLRGLTTIHLIFAKNAGVYDYNRYSDEVLRMTSKFEHSEKEAARISAWDGWDDFICECSLRTNGQLCMFAHRTWTDFSGELGDSFVYGSDWAGVHTRVFDGVLGIIRNFSIGR